MRGVSLLSYTVEILPRMLRDSTNSAGHNEDFLFKRYAAITMRGKETTAKMTNGDSRIPPSFPETFWLGEEVVSSDVSE